ncbi:hypothetical protein [Halalkalibacter oceani]|uniref:DUF4760 domain-containing protein n=1 Tax=Halalkalibacter oceani TaxID=1653776 RepID=A0A9X2DNR4_9BACI|nr:hypothetical protein [Halalkalibacter oceani]MCM3713688.1 hypothetical protein [Halalkalibacter oceani]MCM3762925.1 hypothetical protein [Halalkalibacter oceani]
MTLAYSILLFCTLLLTVISLLIYVQQKKLKAAILTLTDSLKEAERTAATDAETALKEERRAHLLLLCYRLREAVAKQQFDIHAHLISDTPTSHGLSEANLAELFSAEAALVIQRYWSAYRHYLEAHWLDQNGAVKTVFRGKAELADTELGRLHLASKELVKQFDKWLIQLEKAT